MDSYDILLGIFGFIFFGLGIIMIFQGLKKSSVPMMVIGTVTLVPSELFGRQYSEYWFTINITILLTTIILVGLVNYLLDFCRHKRSGYEQIDEANNEMSSGEKQVLNYQILDISNMKSPFLVSVEETKDNELP